MAPLQSSINSTAGSTPELQHTHQGVDGGVEKPNKHDVLHGRGGNINTHSGNIYFRSLIEDNKRNYLTTTIKRQKREITDSIIQMISNRGGRFLSRDEKSGLWTQVSEEKARDKTSQALRENAPEYKKKIEEENEAVRAKQREKAEVAIATRGSNSQNHYHSSLPFTSHRPTHGFNGHPVSPNKHIQRHQASPKKQFRQYTPSVQHYHPSPNVQQYGSSNKQQYESPNKQHYESPHKQHYVNPHEQHYVSPSKPQYGSSIKPEYPADPSNSYHHQSPTDVHQPINEQSPQYNNSKSVFEALAGAFNCPTSLEDIYHVPQPWPAQPSNHHMNPDNSGQYIGQKRNYNHPGAVEQGRDDGENWGYQDSDGATKKPPVYVSLPSDQTYAQTSRVHSEQGIAKRIRSHKDGIPPCAEHESKPYVGGLSWNPLEWSMEYNPTPPIHPPVHSGSNSMEEGQEIQLIRRVGSMSMDHIPSREERNNTYDQETSELRTPPPCFADNDWSLLGCEVFTGMLGLTQERSKDDQPKLTLVPSIDMNDSLTSLEKTDGNNSINSDLNGASLVHVFSDGSNTLSSAGGKSSTNKKQGSEPSESDPSFNHGDSIMGDIDMDL